MGKIFKNQTELRLRFNAGIDLTTASSLLVKYKKPSGVTGQWGATIATATSGLFYVDMATATILNESGDWKFWGAVTFSGGGYAPGEAVKVRVYDEGDE